jgi:hypothetical protein
VAADLTAADFVATGFGRLAFTAVALAAVDFTAAVFAAALAFGALALALVLTAAEAELTPNPRHNASRVTPGRVTTKSGYQKNTRMLLGVFP